MRIKRYTSRAKALAVAYACVALVAVGAAPAAHSRHDARRSLRGIETSITPLAGGNVTTKGLGDVVDTMFTFAGNLLTYGVENWKEHLSGQCNYGNWCGEDCIGKHGTPIDSMDEKCQAHDKCLSIETDPCLRCLCHATMVQDIYILLDDKGCTLDGGNWGSETCQSYEYVKEAPTIVTAISAVRMPQDNCDDYAWRDGCSTQPSSTNYKEEVLYRYEVRIGTSCNSGAGTDGYVHVKFTDETGAWISTGDLDNPGDDRRTCAVDTYEVGLYTTKVLLNSQTQLEVYFKPYGLNPNWEPAYVRVLRGTDGTEDASVKFCSSGVIVDEGWYSFSYCS